MIKPGVFGSRLPRPLSAHRITQLCRAGRIKGAIRPGNEWWVPENAKIEGAGKRVSSVNYDGLSVEEYAALHGVSSPRVYVLLRQKRIEGARKGPHGWDIPAEAPWPAEEF